MASSQPLLGRISGPHLIGIRKIAHELATEASLAASYLRSSLKRDRKSWRLGVGTIALVVAFSAILQAGIETAPVLFLKLSESQAGEGDFSLIPQLSADYAVPFVNFTAIQPALIDGASFLTGSAPRWALLATVSSKAQPARQTFAIVLAIDSDLEASIGLGRAWARRRLGEEEAYVASSALLETGVQADRGERIVTRFDLATLLGSIAEGSGSSGGGDVTGTVAGTTAEDTGGASSAANSSSVTASLTASLLRSLGLDPTVDTSVDGATALQVGLGAAGLPVNSSALAVALPGLRLVRVSLAPIIAAAVGSAVESIETLSAEYSVIDSLPESFGKYPSLLGNVVVVEASVLAGWVRESLLAILARVRLQLAPLLALRDATAAAGGGGAPLATALDDALTALEAGAGNFTYALMQQYAMTVTAQARDRLDWYLRSSPDATDRAVSEAAGAVAAALGDASPVGIATPLNDVLSGLRLLGLFLNQIFYIVVAVLAGLSGVVTYSLVGGDLEAKTYELGMLRALGMRRATLGQLLVLNTAAFAVPGLVIGLLVASAVNVGICAGMGWYTSLRISDFTGGGALPPSAWGLAVGLGLIMPSVAIVVPIARSLGASLRDALDLYHTSLNALTVSITRLKGSWGVDPAQTGVAILLTVAGVCTFVVLPVAFLGGDLSVFLGLLSAVLMAMLLGLTLVALTVQGRVEAVILSVLTGDWTSRLPLVPQSALNALLPDRRLHNLASKHLAGHRGRNRQTAAMVGVTVAFIVFASALFALQGASIITNVKMLLGGDVVAFVPELLPGKALPQDAMTGFLRTSQATSDIIAGYSYVSLPLTSLPFVRRSQLANLVGLPRSQTRLYGVQRNLLDVAFAEYSLVTEARGEGLEAAAAGSSTGGGRGRGSAAASQRYATDHPFWALYDGAGALRLPVEADSGLGSGSASAGYPRPLLTGEFAGPRYVCGEDVAAAMYASSGDGSSTVASAGAWDPSLGWQRAGDGAEAGGQWPPFVDWSPGGPYAGIYRSPPLGRNGTSNPAVALAAAYASAGGTSGGIPSYSSYDFCMLACNARDAGFVNASGRLLLGAACAANTSMSSSDGYAYFGPASAQVPWAGTAAAQLCNATGDGARTRGLPRPCIAGGGFDRAEQERGVAGTYLRYIDILMSESLRGSASLDTSTPLQIRVTSRDPASGSTSVRVYLAKARGMARKVPGFFFSSYATIGGRAPVLMRMRDYARLLSDSQDAYRALAGSSTAAASGAGNGGASGSRAWPPVPTWVASSSDWVLATVPAMRATVVPGNMSGYAQLQGPYLVGAVASFAIDANASTLLVAAPATATDTASAPSGSIARAGALNATSAVTLTVDLGRCASVDGLRLAAPVLSGGRVASVPVRVRLFALSDAAAGGYRLVATATWNASSSSGSRPIFTSEASFATFSARYWTLITEPLAAVLPAGARRLAVPDATLRLSEPPVGTCRAVELNPDDALTSRAAPKQRLIVKLKAGATSDDRQRVLNGLRSTLGASGGSGVSAIRVQDVEALLSSASLALLGLDLLFGFVAAIALTLCFFAAWLSFTSTVKEGSVELGVMRALGLSAAQVTRVFVYESATVVLAAFATGTAVGLGVSISLSLQLGLFLELPFSLRFGWQIYLFMFVACCAMAVAASALPARRLARLPVAHVIKGRT